MDIKLPHGFTPRPYQIPLWAYIVRGGKRAFWCVHRRGGKDLTCWNIMITMAAQRVGNYKYLFPDQTHAKKVIWYGKTKDGRSFLDFIPKALLDGPPNSTELLIKLKNGSHIQLDGTMDVDRLLGQGPVGIVFSEYQKHESDVWPYVSPMLKESDGWAIFNGTARPPAEAPHFKRMLDAAITNPSWFSQVLTIDETKAYNVDDVEQEIKDGVIKRSEARQEYWCVPPGTKIYTANGQRDIESISVGDIVLSHSGRMRPVTKTYCREYSGDMVSIVTYGEKTPLSLTPGHMVRTYNPEDKTFGWEDCANISNGMYLVRPRRKTSNPIIGAELAELMAWYVAEGSFSKNCVQITLGPDEEMESDRVMRCVEALGLGSTQSVGKSSRDISINSCSLADFLVSTCGKGAKNKRIPLHMISGHERLFFDTLMLGDGCMSRQGDKDIAVYVTVSESLARDFQMLSGILGYRCGISKKTSTGKGMICGREVNISDKYEVRAVISGNSPVGNSIAVKHGIAVRVRSVSKGHYSGSVYNLAVQHENSYVANGRAVHNCDFYASTDNILIPVDLLKSAIDRKISFRYAPIVAGLDVGMSLGGDPSALVVRQGGQILGIYEAKFADTESIIGWASERLKKHFCNTVVVDSIGWGKGVADGLPGRGFNVIKLNVSEGAAYKDMFARRRDELWWATRDFFDEKQCCIPSELELHRRLINELSGVEYGYTPGTMKIKVEGKVDMKKRLGCSPNLADALVMSMADEGVAADAYQNITKPRYIAA